MKKSNIKKAKLIIDGHSIDLPIFEGSENEKAIDITGRQKMTTLQALPEIEDLARKSILKMIILSQEEGFKEFNYSQLITKIEESVFDTSLKERFVLIEKEF